MSIKNSSKYLFYLSDIAMDWSDHAMWWPEKNIWLDNTRWTLDQYNITGYLLSEYKYSKKLNQSSTGQCPNVSATPNGARNRVISIGSWGVFNHEKGAI